MPWAYLKEVDLADRYRRESTGMEGLSVCRAQRQQKVELTIMTGMKRDFNICRASGPASHLTSNMCDTEAPDWLGLVSER